MAAGWLPDSAVDDPAGKRFEAVRPILDEIARRVDALLRDLIGAPHGNARMLVEGRG